MSKDLVLIVSNPNDLHAKYISSYLEELNYRTRILDLSDFYEGITVTCSNNGELAARLFEKTQQEFSGRSITSVWYRRPSQIQVSNEILSQDDISFAKREWAQVVAAVMHSLNAFFVNPIFAQQACVKPTQLAFAQMVGLNIPDTMITSRREDVEKFLKKYGEKVIHKSMTPHRQQPLYARKWLPSDYEWLDNLTFAPAIFQEEIEGKFDIRVTIIGEVIFAAKVEIGNNVLDSRLLPDAPYEACRLPHSLEEKLLHLMHKLGLVFGCVDLRLTLDNEYVFFEINPQGQFIYIEIWTGQQISKTFSEFLAHGHTIR